MSPRPVPYSHGTSHVVVSSVGERDERRPYHLLTSYLPFISFPVIHFPHYIRS